MLRREERAAVLIRDDRDRERADALRFGADLVLVHADERPQDLQRRRLRDRRHVLERLRRHLADHLAGDERARMRLAREALGDAQHQPPVDHHAQRGRHREDDLLLQLAERDEHEPRAQLVLGQKRRDLAHLLLRRARQNRIAVEMNQQHRAAAAHHPVRGDRRVDARREQARDAPAGAVGRPPAPGSLPKK